MRRNERGVTLVELLITMALLGIIGLAVVSALFVGFRTTRDTRTSLAQSNTAQLVTTYVTKDIQAADADPAYDVMSACNNEVVALETKTRSDPLAATSDVTVTYKLTGTSLVRRVCGGPDAGVIELAGNVAAFAASGADPVVIDVTTEGNAAAEVDPFAFSFEVRRRQ